jgi:MFS family permease
MMRRLAALALVVTVALPFAVRTLMGGEPSALVASEVDALEGGVRIAEALTVPGDTGLRDRLREGFRPPPGHPRLERLMGSDEGRRLVLVPPAPRWIAAIGVSGLPGPDATANGHRASVAAALVFALAGLLLAWHLGPWRALAVTAAVVAIPDARDAMSAFGYGASAYLGMALLLVGLDRATRRLDRGAPDRWGALVTSGLVVGGLAVLIGTHPFMIAAPIAAWLAVALGRGPDDADPTASGTLRVPRLPVTLLLWPVLALALVAVSWPALWAGTGKRLVAYVVEAGAFAANLQTIGAETFEQAANRAPQGFTALLQFIAWTPLPILALGVGGLIQAPRPGRTVLLAGILTPLLVGALDGGLLGARLSLWPFLWLPLGWAAVLGGEWLSTRLARVGPAEGWKWPRTAGVVATGALGLTTVLALSGAADALARRTGQEAGWPLPLSLFDANADEAGAVEVAAPERGFGPGIDVMRDHLERGWSVADGGAAWTLGVVRSTDADTAEAVWRGLALRLDRRR